MLMSRKGNIKKEMFQPMTECVNSLTIDDVTGQAVLESGTGRTECSVADGCIVILCCSIPVGSVVIVVVVPTCTLPSVAVVVVVVVFIADLEEYVYAQDHSHPWANPFYSGLFLTFLCLRSFVFKKTTFLNTLVHLHTYIEICDVQLAELQVQAVTGGIWQG